MLNKFLYAFWFICRPSYYLHFLSLIKRKFLFNHDTDENKKKAYEWASENSTSYSEALKKLDIIGEQKGLDDELLAEACKLELKSTVKMGGSAHINLLYDCVKILKPANIIETGVAFGWSSLAILKAISENNCGKLISVDMPYPRKNNEEYVGIVVPNKLRNDWTLIRKPDIPGINHALSLIGNNIDLCHYDSDKSWWGRHYAYIILWKALNSKGLFITDDIQDNLYFSKFVKNNYLKFAVIEFQGKFVGLIRKS